LRSNRQIGTVLVINGPIHASGKAVFKERRWDNCSRLSSQRSHKVKLGQRIRLLGDRGVLALPLVSEKSEQAILLDMPAERSTKPLPRVRWSGFGKRIVVRVGELLGSVQRLITEKPE